MSRGCAGARASELARPPRPHAVTDLKGPGAAADSRGIPASDGMRRSPPSRKARAPPPVNEPSPSFPPERLGEIAARTAWIRRLAAGLTSDPELARDAAQATERAALERGGDPPRAWLGRVLANRVRDALRREAERRPREARAARGEALPSGAELALRVELQREVLRAVLELDEPYRSTVLWRHFEELPPRAIAERAGLPLATVTSRLARAHARLRERLERSSAARRGGGLSASLALLAGAPGGPRLPTPPLALTRLAAGALAVKSTLVAAAALAAVALAVLALRTGAPASPTPEPPRVAARAPAGALDLESPDAGAARAAAAPGAGAGPARARSSGGTAAASAERVRVLGSARDADGRPLAGLFVRAGGARAACDAAGAFELEADDPGGQVVADDAGWTTVVAGRVPERGREREGVLVVAAPALELAGRVVDAGGRPVAGASVAAHLPADFAARFAESFDHSRGLAPSWRAETDAGGRFALAGVGRVAGLRVVARRDNFLPADVAVELAPPGAAQPELVLMLAAPPDDPQHVRGVVVDPWGRPVAGALVGMGRASTATGDDGRFALERARARGEREVVALARGYPPARALAPAPEASPAGPFLHLQLTGELQCIAGVVTDAEGAPVAGARVWAADARPVAGLPGGPGFAEAWLGGASTLREVEHEARAAGGELGAARLARPTSLWGWVETDAAGRFELCGLEPRDYELGAFAPDGLRLVRAGPFGAGSRGVRVALAPEVVPVVAGRAVGRDGRPLAGVLVEANCVPVRLSLEHPDGSRATWAEPTEGGPSEVTGDDGRFRFEGLGATELFLTLSSDAVVARHVGLAPGGLAAGDAPLDDLEVVLERRVRLRVELSDPSLADELAALDADGEPLELILFEDGGMDVARRRPLRAGRSRVYSASERVAEVALYRGSVEVLRLPVRPDLDGVNAVRW